VRLLLNGKEVGVKDACARDQVHPPVIFEGVEFEEGTLKAEAIVGEEVKATYEVTTPKKAVKLVLSPHWAGVNEWKADGADLLMVHVSALDENGSLVYGFENEIEFSVNGDATIVGDGIPWVKSNPVKAEAGMSAVVLRAGIKGGAVELVAKSSGVETAKITLTIAKSERKELPCKEYEETKAKPTYIVDEKEMFTIPESVKMSQSARWSVGENKPVIASSSKDGFPPSNANTNAVKAPWVAGDEQMPQWWICDLEDEYTLSGVFVGWEKDGVWYDYEILTSIDGVDYTSRVTNRASGQTRKPDRLTSNSTVRFVKVVVHSVSSSDPVGIYQVQIFGKKVEK
jgi:hypothetical protein